MAETVNLWLALSQQARTAYQAYDPDVAGPMDSWTYSMLSQAHDHAVVEAMFKTVTAGIYDYRNFSLYVPGSVMVKDIIDKLTLDWPAHIIVIGAWWMDGRQVGIDTEGAGTPLYPINAQAWRLMPDILDENGVVVSTATSNADLRDVNLLAGQVARVFI